MRTLNELTERYNWLAAVSAPFLNVARRTWFFQQVYIGMRRSSARDDEFAALSGDADDYADVDQVTAETEDLDSEDSDVGTDSDSDASE